MLITIKKDKEIENEELYYEELLEEYLASRVCLGS